MNVLIAIAAVCLLLCAAMIGFIAFCEWSDRAHTRRSWGDFWAASFFLLFAAFLAWEARQAELAHRIIPARGNASWMSPAQAYVAAALLAIAALVLLALSLRPRPKTSDSNATPTI